MYKGKREAKAKPDIKGKAVKAAIVTMSLLIIGLDVLEIDRFINKIKDQFD